MKFKGFVSSINPFKEMEKYQDVDHIARELLEIVNLSGKEYWFVNSLTQAEQRKLDLLLALVQKPKLLLLDEPTSGLSAEQIPTIIDTINNLRRSNSSLTILLVEHKVEVVRKLADRVIVMKEGRVIADGKPDDVIKNKDVIEAYLGAEYA